MFGTAFLCFAANSLVSGSNFDLSQGVLLVTLCTWSTGSAHFNTGLTIAQAFQEYDTFLLNWQRYAGLIAS